MSRVFTMRKTCQACWEGFTITSAASKYCKGDECVKARRKAARLEYKREAQRLARLVKPGSDTHLAQAIQSGE